MKREYSPEVMDAILNVGEGSGNRTPLHIPFTVNQTAMVGPEILEIAFARKKMNKKRFNAIGSLVVGSSPKHRRHLPVLDVDGGASLSEFSRRNITTHKLVLNAPNGGGKPYEPGSNLRDLLGDYGIELELFSAPRGRLEPGYSRGRRSEAHDYINRDVPDFGALRTRAIVLRSKDPIFDVVDSTKEGHSHAFVQTEFHEADHTLLLKELTAIGILHDSWTEMAEAEGMGIVRTPWTEKEVRHVGSDF